MVKKRFLSGAAALAFVAGGSASGEEAPLLVPDRVRADTVIVVAHPDDEGVVAPLLARYALDEKQRVVAVYVTDGPFGPNRVGNVTGPSLALMRLMELHWTLDRLGVAMFYSLGRDDRPVSVDPAVVLREWNREATVGELTRLLRLLRPRRVLTWFPGPVSSHPDHMAAGGAALMACRAAASAQAFPDQIAGEGLRPHTIPDVLVFGQPEKVAYQVYPGSRDPIKGPPGMIEEVPVDVFSASLGRTYTNQAREAMREQRTVGAGSGLGAGGAFDEPLRLIRVFGAGAPPAPFPAPPAPDGSGVRVALKAALAQKFLEDVASEVGAPHLAGVFRPEVFPRPGAPYEASIRVFNGGSSAVRAVAVLEVPDGWKVEPRSAPIVLGAGGSGEVSWRIEPPGGDWAEYNPAAVVLREERGRGELARLQVVIRRWRRAPTAAGPP